MKVDRLLTLNDLLLSWPFMVQGFQQTAQLSHEKVNEEELFNVVSAIIAHPHLGWIGIVSDSFDTKLGFAIVHDSTLLCSPDKTFIIRFLYYLPGQREAFSTLLRAFAVWGKRNRVAKLQYSIKRTSGASGRWLNSEGLRFSKPRQLFEKSI